ncbi:MAG: archease [Planctomycetota bacterium]
MYELFEHTADLGLRVQAPDLDELFAEAGLGLFSVIVDNLDEVRTTRTIDIRIEGRDRLYLLFDWLHELLVTFDTRRLVLTKFRVRLQEDGLDAQALGEELDPDRHRLLHEVKAITYHGLKLEQIAAGWQAEVIVDI